RWARFAGDRWVSEGPVNSMRGRAAALLEAPAGLVWAVRAGAAWRVDFRAGPRADAPAQRFGSAEGLPAMPSTLLLFGDRVVALAAGKLLRLGETGGRFEP